MKIESLDLSNDILMFDFLYVKLVIGRDILSLERCMQYAGHYISSLPSEINYIIGQYITSTILIQFNTRHPAAFKQYLHLFFQQLISSSHITISYEEFAKVITFLLTQKEADEEIASLLTPVLCIRPVLLYVCNHIYGDYIIFTTEDIRDDEEIVMAAVSAKNYMTIAFASERLLDNEDIILAALQRNRMALDYASARIKDDETVILKAMRINGLSLEFASARLKDKENVVITAIGQNVMSCRYINQRLRRNSKVNAAIIQKADEGVDFNVDMDQMDPDEYQIWLNISTLVSILKII